MGLTSRCSRAGSAEPGALHVRGSGLESPHVAPTSPQHSSPADWDCYEDAGKGMEDRGPCSLRLPASRPGRHAGVAGGETWLHCTGLRDVSPTPLREMSRCLCNQSCLQITLELFQQMHRSLMQQGLQGSPRLGCSQLCPGGLCGQARGSSCTCLLGAACGQCG